VEVRDSRADRPNAALRRSRAEERGVGSGRWRRPRKVLRRWSDAARLIAAVVTRRRIQIRRRQVRSLREVHRRRRALASQHVRRANLHPGLPYQWRM
jgi:hypothetical protein